MKEEKLYARFTDIEPYYFCPGVVDHYPEGAVVSYPELTINAVYQVLAHEAGQVRITSKNRISFESETIAKKGSLAARLLSPFDSAGDAIEMTVLPNALSLWMPDVGDEVLVDQQPAVVVGTYGENGIDRIDALEALRGGTKLIHLSRNMCRSSLRPERKYVWGFSMDLKVFHVPAPIYGDGWGAQEGYSFDHAEARTYRLADLDEYYGRITPVFGRDKVDMCENEGKIGFFRQHCGFRGRRLAKCVNGDGTADLKTNDSYPVDHIGTKASRKVPVLLSRTRPAAFRGFVAYDSNRFAL